jgi:hypothetical protein
LDTTSACSQPGGYVANNLDCDDTRNYVYFGAPEICANGIDDDCDSTTDEPGCLTLTPSRTATPSSTSTFTATFTRTDTVTFSPTATPTPTLTASSTETQTLTSTVTSSNTPSSTPTVTPTLTNSPTITLTFTFTSTPTSTPSDLTVSPGDPVTLSGGSVSNGIFYYNDLTIQEGATLFIEGAVTLVLNGDFDLQGTVSGLFLESCTGSGQNGGFPDVNGGGGAGHGGAGGSGGGSFGGAGGQVTETTANPVLPGCMGGSGNLNIGTPGMGGAVLILQAPDGNAFLSGTIDLSGTEFTEEAVGKAGNGGGSGGTINIQARSITGSGTLEARGGNGQTSNGPYPFPSLGGGGGGGGIISLSASLSNTFNGTLSVQGGPGGFGAQPGGDGQTYSSP